MRKHGGGAFVFYVELRFFTHWTIIIVRYALLFIVMGEKAL